MGSARADATIAASGLRGAADIARVNATVKGDRQRGFDIALQAAGRADGREPRGQGRARGRRDPHRAVALRRTPPGHSRSAECADAIEHRRPADQDRSHEPRAWAAGGFRSRASSILRRAISRLDLTALPLSLIDTFAPGTGLDGNLQARARITGPTASPRIEATYAASRRGCAGPGGAAAGAWLAGIGLAGRRPGELRCSPERRRGSNLALRGGVAMAPLAGSVTPTGPIAIAPSRRCSATRCATSPAL
jgi:hypothetical protein